MESENTADNIKITKKDIPKNLPKYSKNDLGYLLNILWEETDSSCDQIKRALVTSCLKPEWFWNCLVTSGPRPVKWVFKYPFKDLPLLTNSRSKYVKVVLKWRLEIDR